MDRVVFPDVHSVIVLASSRLLNLECATGHPSFVRSFMFIHEPGAECRDWRKWRLAQMSCCLRHDLFQGISNRMTKDLKGMIVDNIKPQVDRFVFPDVHRVIVVASGRVLKPLVICLSRCRVPSRSSCWRSLIY